MKTLITMLAALFILLPNTILAEDEAESQPQREQPAAPG